MNTKTTKFADLNTFTLQTNTARKPAQSRPHQALITKPKSNPPATLSRGGLTVKHIVPTVEITIGPDPMKLMQGAIRKISNAPLQEFLSSVLAERDVNLVLTTLPLSSSKHQRFPIDRLRSAAEMVQVWCAYGPQERQVLYVATLIAGIESLLGDCVVPPCTARDVISSVVRTALHRLDNAAPTQAGLLRLCLGWGNEDDTDAYYVPGLQETVRRAAQKMRQTRPVVR